jgi:hypothetical protein
MKETMTQNAREHFAANQMEQLQEVETIGTGAGRLLKYARPENSRASAERYPSRVRSEDEGPMPSWRKAQSSDQTPVQPGGFAHRSETTLTGA